VLSAIESIKVEILNTQKEIAMQKLRTVGEVSYRLNVILKKANDEESRVMASYESEVVRKMERTEGLRNRLTDFGLSVDQVRLATIDPFQGPESGLITGRSTLNEPLSARYESEDKLFKLLSELKISDSYTLAKKSIEEIALRIRSSHLCHGAGPCITSGQGVGSTVNYLNGYSIQAQTQGQPIRLSGTSQRASSVGGNLLGTTIQYSSNTTQPVPTLNANHVIGNTSQTNYETRAFGGAISNRVTIGNYQSQPQPSTLAQAATGHYPTIRASNTTSRTVQYPSNPSPITSTYQPLQSIGTTSYQPASSIGSYQIRQEGSIGQPTSTYLSPSQPYSQIRPLAGTNQVGQPNSYSIQNEDLYSRLPVRAYHPTDPAQLHSQPPTKPSTSTQVASTSIGMSGQPITRDPVIGHVAETVTRTAQKQPGQEVQIQSITETIKQAVDKEAKEEQDKLGIMSKEYEAKIDRVHKQDDQHEHELKEEIRKLTVAKSSVEGQLEDLNRRYTALDAEFKLYKTSITPQASESEEKTKISEVLNQLSEERRETVKMRDLILHQGELIENLKSDMSKRELRVKEIEGDIEAKKTEIAQYKAMIEETTNTMKRHLDENRSLKQQTLIQEYQTKEIVSQNNTEIHQLVQKVHDLETELRNQKGTIGESDSPVHNRASDRVIQSHDFHIQTMSTLIPKEQRGSEGRKSDSKQKSACSESEIINNLANFLATPSQGNSKIANETSIQLTEEQKQNLASMLRDPGVNQVFGSMLSAQLSSKSQKEKELEEENKMLKSHTMPPQATDNLSPQISGVLKPISVAQATQLPHDESAQKFITTMTKYMNDPNRLRQANQTEFEELAAEVTKLSESFHNVEASRDHLAEETKANIQKLTEYLRKIETLEEKNKTIEVQLSELRLSESQLKGQLALAQSLQESQVIESKSDLELRSQKDVEELKKSVLTLQDSERKLQKHLEIKEEELKSMNTLVEKLSSNLDSRQKELSELQKSTIKEAEIINQSNEEKNKLLDSLRVLNARVQELENIRMGNEAREKASTEGYLQKISALTEQLSSVQLSPQQPISPKRIENTEMTQDLEFMEQQAVALHKLVATQPATPTTRDQANKMLDQIGVLCNKISSNKSGNERKDIERIAGLAMKVNQSHFQLDNISELAQGINQYKSSVLTFGNQSQESATFGSNVTQSVQPAQPAQPIASTKAAEEQTKLIETLKHAIFELDQSKAGLAQQNHLLQAQVSHLTERLREAESHSLKGSHISQSSKSTPGGVQTESQPHSPSERDVVQVYATQVAQLTDKIHRLEVSINVKRMSDHILKVSRAGSRADAHKQVAHDLKSVSEIASSLEQSPKTKADVRSSLNRIAFLAKTLSLKKAESDSNKSNQGSSAQPGDEVTIEEIQTLINKVQSAHLSEPVELAAMTQHPENPLPKEPEDITKLKNSISVLEELVSQRDIELKSSQDEISQLSTKVVEYEEHIRLRTAEQSLSTTAAQPADTSAKELETLRGAVFELSQNKAGLSQENENLKQQVAHLLDRVREAESQVHLARQQTGISSKYHDETISQSKMVRELHDSQLSNLSGDSMLIPGHQVIGGESDKTKGLLENIAHLSAQIHEYQVSLKAKDDELSAVKQQNEGLQSQVANLGSEVSSLRVVQKDSQSGSKAETEKFQANITSLSTEITQLKVQIDGFRDSEVKLNKQIEELKAELAKSSELKARETKLAAEKEALDTERARIEREKKEIVNLQNQVLDKNEQRLRKFSEQGSGDQDVQARVEKLEKDLKDAKEEKTRIKNNLTELETSKKIADIEFMESKKQREKVEKNFKDKIEALTKENGELTKDLKAKDVKIDKIETELYKIRGENRGLVEEIKITKAQFSKITQSLLPSAGQVTDSQVSNPQVSARTDANASIVSKESPEKQESLKKETISVQTPAQETKKGGKKPEKDEYRVKDSQVSQPNASVKSDIQGSIVSKGSPDKQETQKEEKTSFKSPGQESKKTSKKPEQSEYRVKESQEVVISNISPPKQEKPLQLAEDSKQQASSNLQQSDKTKKTEQRKQSQNEGASWLEGFSEDDSEDPDKLFTSYQPPASLTSPPAKQTENKSQNKGEEKQTARGAETGRATKGDVTESGALTESQATKRSKISQQTESRGGKSKKTGKGRNYDDDDEDEYYVKKDAKGSKQYDEYREKEPQKGDNRGAKTKRDEVSLDTDRHQGPTSSPNRFGEDKDASERFEAIKPTFMESEFVEKKAKPTPQVAVASDHHGLHHSVKETSKPVVVEHEAVSKSQQNPVTNPYTSPLLREEDLVQYEMAGEDGLLKLSDVSMGSFDLPGAFDEMADNMDKDAAHKTERSEKKSETVGKASQESPSGDGKKKKKKKGKTGGDSGPLVQELNWLKLMGKN
jgi:chromosome segregation ATPase